jgi:hypothetical protein
MTLRDNFTMYVLQSCNSCTIENLSWMYLATHVRCSGTGKTIVQALQSDGRISRAYIGCLHWSKYLTCADFTQRQGKWWHSFLHKGFGSHFCNSITEMSDGAKHRYSMAQCCTGPYYNRTTQKCNRTAITRRPCFHLTAALQTSCDNDFLKLKSYRMTSAVM